MQTADVAVVGGGMVGAAIAYGLTRRGIGTIVLDEGDVAFRAARGNFGLVWVQTKGLGMQRYAEWTRESADLYPDFAAELHAATGIDTGYEKPGGLMVALDEAELNRLRWTVAQMNQQAGPGRYDCEILDRRGIEQLLPEVALGADVVGGSWSPHDGHANPLHLLRAMHTGFQRSGGRYLPGHRVETITRDGGAFVLTAGSQRFSAGKVVLAAGHGIPRLAALLGMAVPTRPERGQILVTERAPRMLPLPIVNLRQTIEGSFMIGASQEDVGFHEGTTMAVAQALAARAVRVLPALARLRVVRTWGALRVLPPDRFPIYDESPTHPGAYVATMHSGVTLAAVHARRLAAWIAGAETPPDFERFSLRRFDVPAAA